MCLAARLENPSIVKLLLEAGADPSSTDENGESSLHCSVGIHSLENTRLLLEAGAPVEARAGLRDGTPLMHAILIGGYSPMMRLLLDHGADVNAKGTGGDSCLHMAIESVNVEATLFLLERGVNIKARNKRGSLALHYAADLQANTLSKCLLDKHKDDGSLQYALEARANNGCTPLHFAARSNSDSNAKLLLEAGASVEARQEDGDTPLHAAIESARADYAISAGDAGVGDFTRTVIVDSYPCRTMVLLLAAGADPLVMNDLGISPVDLALSKPQFEALHGMKSWHAQQKARMSESEWLTLREVGDPGQFSEDSHPN